MSRAAGPARATHSAASAKMNEMKPWQARVDAVDWGTVRDGKPYESPVPGAWGGHRRSKIYDRREPADSPIRRRLPLEHVRRLAGGVV